MPCNLFVFSINCDNDSKIVSVKNNITNGHDNNESR